MDKEAVVHIYNAILLSRFFLNQNFSLKSRPSTYVCVFLHKQIVISFRIYLTAFIGTASDHFYCKRNPNKADPSEVFGVLAFASFCSISIKSRERMQTVLSIVGNSGTENISTHSHHLVKKTWGPPQVPVFYHKTNWNLSPMVTPWKANLLGECRAFPEGFKIFSAQLYKWCFANSLNSSLSESEVAQSCPTLCDPMDTRLLCPWDFLGKGTGVGCHFLLQGIFLTQGLSPGLPHCRQTLYHLSHQGSHSSLSYMQMGHVRLQLSQPGWKKEPAELGEKPSPVVMESCPLCSWDAWQRGGPRTRHTGALFPGKGERQGGGDVVQSLIHVWLFVTPWTATRQASCPSLSPWVCSNSCPLSLWYHPTISSSVAPFSSCLQSFPASGSFPKAMSGVRKVPYQTPPSLLQSSPAL